MDELREWPEMCLRSSSTSGKMLCKLTYGVAHVHRFPSVPTWPCRLRKADSVSCSSVGVITGKLTPAGDIATVPYSRNPVSYFRTHGDCSAKAGARLEVTLRVHVLRIGPCLSASQCSAQDSRNEAVSPSPNRSQDPMIQPIIREWSSCPQALPHPQLYQD
jgi:hypothetical protein